MDEEQPPTVEPNLLLDEDPFCNENTQRLFEAIDGLRSCGANHDIGLPELVIVGDQSAGKSSLLQSLTEIPFPVADGLCTRFPTRIVSRRTPNQSDKTKISIEPSPSGWTGAFAGDGKREDREKRLEAYRGFAYSSSNITADGFKDAIDKARKLMDLKPPLSKFGGSRSEVGRNFASDVLKVEISGPDRSYFSILDVPGVFQSLTKDLTRQEKEGVMNLVASYMKPKHSIIICVASGTNDLANQAAFDMASTHDPQLQRTIGVITKCDIAQNKEQIISLAQNEEKHLNHGWFVVRNRTPAELASNISAHDRHNREKEFFDHEPWDALSGARRGTQALKRFLADLLCKRIQETFPSILATVRSQQAVTADHLQKLGTSRETIEEKRTYLTELAQQLYVLTSQTLRGRYHGLHDESLKLRRFVREAHDAFTSEMINHGHSVPFHIIPIGAHPTKGIDRKAAATGPSVSFPSGDGGLFGKAGFGGFGSQGAIHVGPHAPSTKGHPLEAPAIAEGNTGTEHYLQTICSMQPFKNFSMEELRLSDHLQAQPSSANPSSGGSLFKNTSRTQPSGFGSTPSKGDSFGGTSQPQFGGFGSTSNIGNAFKSAFGGTPQPQFGGFGSTSSNGDFSESTPKAQSGFNFGARKDSTGSSQSSATPGSTYEPSHPDTNTAVAQDSNPSKIYEWIREEVKNCRGTELQGTLNPDVLPTLFHRQIAKWKGIATLHFQAVAKITARTLEQAVHTTCCDRATAENVQKLVQQRNRASEDRGLSQIHQRLNEIMTRHLQTQSPTFETNIQDARLARFRAALERYQSRTAFFSEANCPPALRDRITIDPHNVTALFNELHMSNAQNLEDDIHDTLKSYYELALHDFIEFVTQQVVESYLNDPKGPVLFFNPTYIGSLAPETLNNLGAENADVVRERAEKQAKLARLNRAEEIALNYSLAAGS